MVVKLLDFLNSLSDFCGVAFVHSGLVAKLLPPYIDFASKSFILGLKVVELGKGRVEFVLKHLDFVPVLGHLGSRWTNVFQNLPLFR